MGIFRGVYLHFSGIKNHAKTIKYLSPTPQIIFHNFSLFSPFLFGTRFGKTLYLSHFPHFYSYKNHINHAKVLLKSLKNRWKHYVFPEYRKKTLKSSNQISKFYPSPPSLLSPLILIKPHSKAIFFLLSPSHFPYYFHIRKSAKIASFQIKITFIHGVQHKFPIFKHKKVAAPMMRYENCELPSWLFG